MFSVGGVDNAYRSADRGASWQPLRAATAPRCDYRSVAVAPSDPATVYLGGGCGFFASLDGGATWRRLDRGPVGAVSIAVDPRDAAHVYAGGASGSAGAGLWETRDGGRTWRRLDAGAGTPVLLLDPRDPNTLYAAGNGADVVRWSGDGGATWADLGPPTPTVRHDVRALLVVDGPLLLAGAGGVWRLALPAPHDARYSPQTGFRVDNDLIWEYVSHRGGLDAFGPPVSRTFLLQGFVVQLFRRRAVQLHGRGQPRVLNLLDPGLLPYTSFDGTPVPAFDPVLVGTAPDPRDAGPTLAWVTAHAPDTFDGRPVNFHRTFLDGALELWGVPISRPTVDPAHPDVVSLRWQRGVTRYDGGCRCTRAILPAGALAALLSGVGIPADVAREAAASPFARQFDPARPRAVRDPAALPLTDLSDAFAPQ